MTKKTEPDDQPDAGTSDPVRRLTVEEFLKRQSGPGAVTRTKFEPFADDIIKLLEANVRYVAIQAFLTENGVKCQASEIQKWAERRGIVQRKGSERTLSDLQKEAAQVRESKAAAAVENTPAAAPAMPASVPEVSMANPSTLSKTPLQTGGIAKGPVRLSLLPLNPSGMNIKDVADSHKSEQERIDDGQPRKPID